MGVVFKFLSMTIRELNKKTLKEHMSATEIRLSVISCVAIKIGQEYV